MKKNLITPLLYFLVAMPMMASQGCVAGETLTQEQRDKRATKLETKLLNAIDRLVEVNKILQARFDFLDDKKSLVSSGEIKLQGGGGTDVKINKNTHKEMNKQANRARKKFSDYREDLLTQAETILQYDALYGSEQDRRECNKYILECNKRQIYLTNLETEWKQLKELNPIAFYKTIYAKAEDLIEFSEKLIDNVLR